MALNYGPFRWPSRRSSAPRSPTARYPPPPSRPPLRFTQSTNTSDLNNGTLVATLPGAWHYRVRARTGWPGASMLLPGEIASLISDFYLSMAARTIVSADPSLRYSSLKTKKNKKNKKNLSGVRVIGLAERAEDGTARTFQIVV